MRDGGGVVRLSGASIDVDSLLSRYGSGTFGARDAYIYPTFEVATCSARVHPDVVGDNHGALRLTEHCRDDDV